MEGEALLRLCPCSALQELPLGSLLECCSREPCLKESRAAGSTQVVVSVGAQLLLWFVPSLLHNELFHFYSACREDGNNDVFGKLPCASVSSN